MPPREQPFSRVGRDAVNPVRRPMSIDGVNAVPPQRAQVFAPVGRPTAPAAVPAPQAPMPPQPLQVVSPSAPAPQQQFTPVAPPLPAVPIQAELPPQPPPQTQPQFQPQGPQPTPPLTFAQPAQNPTPSAPNPFPTPPLPTPSTAPRARLSIPKRVTLVGSASIALIILGAGLFGAWTWHSNQTNHDKIFAAALSQSFSTTSLTESVSDGTSTDQANFDFSNPKNTVVDATSDINYGGANFEAAAYGSVQSSYFSFTKVPSDLSDASAQTVQNRWVQLRAGGKLLSTADRNLDALANPRTRLIGPLVFGNFNAKDRQQLVNYALTNQVYKYDTTKVTKQQFDGKTAWAFPVSVDVGFLKVFNQSAATIAGFGPSDTTLATNALDNLKEASLTLFIDPATHHFVGLTTQSGDTSRSYSYTNYNQAKVAIEPQTHLTWEQFAPLTYQMEAQIASQQSPAIRDAARQQNLASLHDVLKTYFDQNGTYPTLANLNDINWVQQNLGTVDTSIFRDPVGTTLKFNNVTKVGQYAYQAMPASSKGGCNNLDQPCAHYKLTAVLSTNKPYTVQDP